MSSEEDKKSYGEILKSTGIIGGAQVIVILIGIIRTKIIAVILGPLGYGISSSLQATVDLMRQATGFGLNYSAVREISQEAISNDKQAKGRILTVLKRWAIYTGLLGVVLTVAMCLPLSWYAFDNADYKWHIAAIAIVLLLTSVSSAQVAVLQGFRQLRNMALSSIFGALTGTVVVVPLYFVYGISAIVPGMILSAITSLGISWYYARRIKYPKVDLTFKQTLRGGIGMAKLGFYLVATSFIVTLIMYTIRAFIVRRMDIEAVGWFQSSWSIANMYIGVVLGAMGADFFPRLSAIHQDNTASNKLINQQLEMVLVIISPLLIGMIAAGPLVINILYSGKFDAATPLLQWQLAGGLLTVVSWCLGVMYLSKNKGHYALITESIWAIAYFLFIVLTWDVLGFLSLGVGYVVATLIKTIIVIVAVRKLGNFNFERRSLGKFLVYLLLMTAVLVTINLFDGIVQYAINGVIFIIGLMYSYRKINEMFPVKILFGKLFKRK